MHSYTFSSNPRRVRHTKQPLHKRVFRIALQTLAMLLTAAVFLSLVLVVSLKMMSFLIKHNSME